jgi:FkbM family methyltransferase
VTVIPYSQAPPYYSQWGEDRWIVEHLEPPSRGVFVDIGAGDGVRGSNTLYFENLGWTGLCVDPDPRNRDPLRARHCVTDARAISNVPGPQLFSMYGPKSSWSGLGDRGPGYRSITVDCVRLGDLLAQLGVTTIDLISLDVEGTELDVWHSFTAATHRPGIVIIEYDDSREGRNTVTLQHELGGSYELVHRTPANLIFHRTNR